MSLKLVEAKIKIIMPIVIGTLDINAVVEPCFSQIKRLAVFFGRSIMVGTPPSSGTPVNILDQNCQIYSKCFT